MEVNNKSFFSRLFGPKKKEPIPQFNLQSYINKNLEPKDLTYHKKGKLYLKGGVLAAAKHLMKHEAEGAISQKELDVLNNLMNALEGVVDLPSLAKADIENVRVSLDVSANDLVDDFYSKSTISFEIDGIHYLKPGVKYAFLKLLESTNFGNPNEKAKLTKVANDLLELSHKTMGQVSEDICKNLVELYEEKVSATMNDAHEVTQSMDGFDGRTKPNIGDLTEEQLIAARLVGDLSFETEGDNLDAQATHQVDFTDHSGMNPAGMSALRDVQHTNDSQPLTDTWNRTNFHPKEFLNVEMTGLRDDIYSDYVGIVDLYGVDSKQAEGFRGAFFSVSDYDQKHFEAKAWAAYEGLRYEIEAYIPVNFGEDDYESDYLDDDRSTLESSDMLTKNGKLREGLVEEYRQIVATEENGSASEKALDFKYALEGLKGMNLENFDDAEWDKLTDSIIAISDIESDYLANPDINKYYDLNNGFMEDPSKSDAAG